MWLQEENQSMYRCGIFEMQMHVDLPPSLARSPHISWLPKTLAAFLWYARESFVNCNSFNPSLYSKGTRRGIFVHNETHFHIIVYVDCSGQSMCQCGTSSCTCSVKSTTLLHMAGCKSHPPTTTWPQQYFWLNAALYRAKLSALNRHRLEFTQQTSDILRIPFRTNNATCMTSTTRYVRCYNHSKGGAKQ